MTRILAPARRPVGDLLREWRQRRRLSQLDFALDVDISQKHLSFIESGRSAPSRDMVLRLAERLDVPLRVRNLMLLAAGYAPVFPELPLDDPALAAARAAIDMVLAGHEPLPALAVDRRWTMLAANAAVPRLIGAIPDATLLRPPVNVLRLSLHPGGLAPRILNLGAWRAHLLDRLRREVDASADPHLVALLEELRAYPAGPSEDVGPAEDPSGLFVPLRLLTPAGPLSLFSTTTVFGTPTEITLSEIAIEAFFPADETTAKRLRQLADPQAPADPTP
ncbi:helix-turn-helix domain-containing protein [Prosthecomicrobium sp. N25]|uniref:helix-turn-helix domain-containing protein n=1 Tax=Prosthecomicrobium sp. N25 TaxID=3129254 RepID=UPI0030782914